MMKQRLLLLTVLVVILLQAACNRGKGNTENANSVKVEVDNYIYDILETKYDFDKDIDISMSTVYMRGNYLYFAAYGTDAYPLEEKNGNGYHMCRYDIANDEFVILYDGSDGETAFGALYVTENEDIVILKYYAEWNEETSVSEIRIAKSTYGTDGTLKENIVISDTGIDTNDAAYINIRECKLDDNGNIYVVYEYNDADSLSFDICMYDAKGIFKNRVSVRDKQFYSMVIDNEGRAVVCYGGALNNSECCECMYPDFENGKKGETLGGLSAGDYIGFLKKNDNASDERKVLKIASLRDTSDVYVQNIIVNHNRTDTEYKIEYTSYDETRKNPQENLMMDIAAGYAPDILLLGSKNVNLLVNRGLLCDLTI